MIFEMGPASKPATFFRILVGIGSRGHDELSDSNIKFLTSFIAICANVQRWSSIDRQSKNEVSFENGSEGSKLELLREEKIPANISEKKLRKLLASSWSDDDGGRITSLLLHNRWSRSRKSFFESYPQSTIKAFQ